MTLVRWMAVVVVAGVLAGCNTIEGMGKDIQKGGEAIEKSAK